MRSRRLVIKALVGKLNFVQDNQNHKVFTLCYKKRKVETFLSHSKSKKKKDVDDHTLNLMASEMGIHLGLFKSIIDCYKSFNDYIKESIKFVDISGDLQ